MRTKRALSLLGLALLGLLSGCRRGAHDPNTIRFRYWGDIEEVKIVEGLLKEFEQAHPGIHIVPERKSADGNYTDILLQEFVAGVAPDVIFTSTTTMAMLASTQQLLDLRPLLQKENGLKESDYYPLMTQSFSFDGKLLALPRDTSPVCVVYYNKALFDAAKLPYPKDDWTWDDLRKDAKLLTKGDQWGFDDDFDLNEAWMLAAGGGMVDDYRNPTRLTASSPASLEGFLFRWNLLQKDKVMLASKAALQGGSGALFQNGKLAMFHSGLWKVPAFRQIKDFKWDIVRFPSKKGVKNPRYLSGGSGYAIRANTAKPDVCWELLKFIAGPEGQKRLAASGLIQPALRTLANDPSFIDGKDPQNKQMLNYAAERGVATPTIKAWPEFISSIWIQATGPLWLTTYKGSEEDIKKVLKEVDQKGDKLLFPKKN